MALESSIITLLNVYLTATISSRKKFYSLLCEWVTKVIFFLFLLLMVDGCDAFLLQPVNLLQLGPVRHVKLLEVLEREKKRKE